MIIKFLRSPNAGKEPVGSRPPSAGAGTNSAAAAELMEAVLTSESTRIVAAHLTEQDYRLARLTMPEMRAFEDYEDWLDFRAGTIFGLEMAGFTVQLVLVDWAAFSIWRRSTSNLPSISALDQFAFSCDRRAIGGRYGRGVL